MRVAPPVTAPVCGKRGKRGARWDACECGSNGQAYLLKIDGFWPGAPPGGGPDKEKRGTVGRSIEFLHRSSAVSGLPITI